MLSIALFTKTALSSHFTFNMSVRPLPPDLQKRAIAELNEDPKRVQEDICHIKEWLKKQPHLTARTGKLEDLIR